MPADLRQIVAWLRGQRQRPVIGEYVPVGRGKLLLGVTHHDPADDCAMFEEGDPGQGTCQTDGHYLCDECRHMDPETLRERRGEEPSDV